MAEKPTYEQLESRVKELERKEEELSQIFSMSLDMICIADIKTATFIKVNPSFIENLGYSEKELLEKSFLHFIHPEDIDATRTVVEKKLQEGAKVINFENRYRCKNGTYRWLSWVSHPRIEQGVTYAVARDITEWKRNEERVRKSEAKFRQVYEHMAIGVASVSLEFRIEGANDAYCSMLGYAENELIGKHLKDITHPETLEKNLLKQLQLARGEIDHFRMEKSFIHKNGHVIHGILDANLIRDSAGSPLYFLGSVLDISDLKRTEEALRKRNLLLERITENMFDMVSLSDLEGNYVFAGKSHEKILGYSTSELIGKNVMDFVHPEDFQRIAEELQSSLNAEGPKLKTVQYRYKHKQGHYLWFETVGELLMNKDHAPEEIIFSTRDITERIKMEERIQQAQKMESVGRLAGGVAHDFNNMLGVILGHTELAMMQADENHDLYSDLKEIQTAAQRSADITKQLLAFARKQIISPRRLDLNDTVESMLNMLRRLIGEDIDLVWQPAAHLWPVKMDPTQIDQILANLCVNARDAISGVGKLTIETGKKTFDEQYCNQHPGFIPGDFVLLAVSDNGCGMDRETLANMFEPFFTTKEVGKGTGLGLATIYGIVKQNNGFINVYSEPGQGSTFRIYLPRLIADEDVDKDVPEKKAAAGGTETILLVEDDPTILRMTRMMLEKKGYSVLSAATPAEAVELAKTHADKIHLLMSDVVMPEMNGRDLAGQITALYPGIRLLFMSGYTANVIAHHGVLDDGVAFIQKPFSMADMTGKVREVLDMAPDKHQG